MADGDGNAGLFAIDLDADDYAEAAARDRPSTVSRTHQTEADFQAQKASYTAKVDKGDLLAQLYASHPELRDLGAVDDSNAGNGEVAGDSVRKKLDKRDALFLGYVVGQLYYEHRYEVIYELCARVQHQFDVDHKTAALLDKWSDRAKERCDDVDNQAS